MVKFLILFVSLRVLSCVCAQGNPDEIKAGEQFQFGQKVEPKNEKEMNYTAKLSFKYETSQKKSIGVYDKWMGRRMYQKLRAYLTSENDAWTFNNYDPEDSNAQKTTDNTPWTNNREPEGFSHTRLCRIMIGAVKHRLGLSDELFPYRVQGKIIRRGDHTLVAADSDEPDEYTALIFMTMKWHKNHYGELYFYDDSREIIAGVTPHGGRMVVWDSTILKLNRPPGVSFKQGQLIFTVTFTKSKQKMMQVSRQWRAFRKERDDAYKSWHLPEMEIPAMDIAKHVVRNFTTAQDFKIFVFDNLFPQVMLDKLRAFVLRYGIYFYDDSLDDPTSDNVQWIAGFPMQDYVKGAYWKIVKQVAAYATGREGYFPYDVSINLIRNADHTKIHHDCSEDEREWTFLLYLTPNWTQNYYGETVFLDRNSDDTEIAAEVLPKYGRAVIFQGNIPHSARPPSLNYTGVRLSFASKLSESEFYGRKKNLVEELRHFNALEYSALDSGVTNPLDIEAISDVVEEISVDEEEMVKVGDNSEDGPEEGDVGSGDDEEGEGEDGGGELPEGVTPEMMDKFISMQGKGQLPDGISPDVAEKLLKLMQQQGSQEGEEEGKEKKSTGKYGGGHEEEADLPPVSNKIQTKLRQLEKERDALEVSKLYNKMADIRTTLKAETEGLLTTGL